MKRDEKLLKELELEDFDTFQIMYFIFDISCNSSELEKEEVIYSKKFFTNYYGISGEMLSKWIQIFCPNLAPDYKSKRKFNSEEVEYIFQNLGSLPYKHSSLMDRKEAMKAIYSSYNWKKSRQYKEFSLMLKESFPYIDIKLNKLPPKLMFKILKEELEELDGVDVSERNIGHEKRLYTLFLFLEMYKKMSPHAWEVRRRWFRRWINSPDPTESKTDQSQKLGERFKNAPNKKSTT